MRKALVVGIDHYTHCNHLSGCVNDAHAVKAMLERHADGSVNFGVKLMVGSRPSDIIQRNQLRDAIRQLFQSDADIALLYFAGHGYIEDAGGFLCAGDSESGDDGVSLNDVMTWATNSRAKNKVILLDSCHSGIAGDRPTITGVTEIKEGMTILTASEKDQYAQEKGGGGVFTTLLVDALGGAAANLLGEITPGSVYAHIDQSLGPWDQRPVFKTNVKSFVSLRTATAPIPLTDLQALPALFPTPGHHFQLDPSHEPERSPSQLADPSIPPPDPQKNEVFARLQRLVRVNLVVPVDAPHMWHAAMQSKSCKLTVLGEHYRRLVENGQI